MMKKNVLIVEDNRASMDALVELTRECDSASVIYCATNSAMAYKYAMENRIDLFLVDIMLDSRVQNDVSGIVFADKMRQQERYKFVPMIFVTALEDQAMVAFHKLHCFGYIEKPFDFDRVRKTIREALQYPIKDERESQYFYYRKDGILYSIETDRIIYAEACMRVLSIHLPDETVQIPYMTCNSLLEKLNSQDFLQYSRNGILNRKYIDYIDETNRYIRMKNGDMLEIGRVLKKRFIQELNYGC